MHTPHVLPVVEHHRRKITYKIDWNCHNLFRSWTIGRKRTNKHVDSTATC